jgi:Spy/CpxP family protein refolding chaperone
MKSTIQRALFAVAVATIGAGAVGTASAQTSAPAATTTALPPGAHHGHRHHGFGGSFVGTLLHATRQLSGANALTAAQQAQIKSILQTERASHAAGTHAPAYGPTVVGNPSSTNTEYGAAVSAAVTAATNRIENDSNLAKQIYAALNLTPGQQAQLQTILAAQQARQQAQRAAWAARHAAGNG